MMDERQRVIRDLLVRLHEVGVRPDRPFLADFIPGQGWTFSQDDDVNGNASSASRVSATEDVDETKVRTPLRR